MLTIWSFMRFFCQRMGEAKEKQDFAAFNRADIDFHTALLRASGNIVFQQLSNTIGAALAYSFRMTIERAREPGASMARLLRIALIDLGLS